MRERDSCGEHGCGPGEVEGDAGDDGTGDQEGAEGQGGALGGEEEQPQEDWVSAELIGGEVALEEAGRVVSGLGAAIHFTFHLLGVPFLSGRCMCSLS